jgi:hypothetical protein
MGDKSEALKSENARQAAHNDTSDSDKIREALARLHQLSKDLPQVDAASVIRNIREGASRGIH